MPVFDVNMRDVFPMPTLEQGSPFGGVLSNAIAKRMAHAQAEKAAVEAKYAERNALANAIKGELGNKHQELENQWYEPNIKSEIGYRNAGAGHLGAETRKINQLLPYQIQQIKDTVDESKRSRALQQQIQDIISGGNAGSASSMNPPNANASKMPFPHTPISNMEPTQQNAGNAQENIINPGSPNLSKIDDLYNNNPMARAALEKMGFKKTQQIKVDKSGNPTVVTRYPSGKITVQSQNTGNQETPLTNKMISQHQNVVSSVDVAVPVLDKIINLQNNEYSRAGGWTSKGAKYNGLVKQGLDSILGAFGLPQTNEGIKSILDQLEIGHGESPNNYRERIKELKKDILKRQKYSAGLVKKSVKNSEENNENDPYDLDKYDEQGE